MPIQSKTLGTYALLGLTGMLLASGCSFRAVKGPPSLIVDMRSFSQMNLLRHGNSSAVAWNGFQDFACLAINVTGPGIGDSDPYREDKDPVGEFARTLTGSPCAYRGVVSPPIYVTAASMNGELAIQLPPGNVRMVQLLGVKNPASCANGFFDPPNVNNDGNYYELARSEVRDFFSDRSISLSLIDWGSLTLSEQESYDVDSCADSGANSTPDTVGPVLTLGTVPALVTTSTFNLGVTANEPIAAFCLLLNNTALASCTWINTPPGASLVVPLDSTHESFGPANQVSVWFKDIAGNVSTRTDSTLFRHDSVTLFPTSISGFVSANPGITGKIQVTVTGNPNSYFHEMCILDTLTSSPTSSAGCTWLSIASHQHTPTSGTTVYIHTFVRDTHGNISPEFITPQVTVGI